MKSDHRLSRNFYKGILGDNINVMLAVAAMNFKRMLNKWKQNTLPFIFVRWLMEVFFRFFYPLKLKMAFSSGRTN